MRLTFSTVGTLCGGLLLSASVLLLAGCSKAVPPVDEITADSDTPIDDLPEPQFAEDDWPWWRGVSRQGWAGEQQVPVEWSPTENIVWEAPVPGRGHSSPTIVGDRIFLSTAEKSEQIQAVLCYNRETGEQLWRTDVHRGNFETSNIHTKNSHASPTVACDGERVFANFLNGRAIWLTALDLDGNQLWQQQVGNFDPKWGYAPSPQIYKSLVIVAADHQSGGYLAAVHRETGEIVWRKSRPAVDTYCTPLIAHIAGQDQLVISGGDRVASYDPRTGEELWSTKGTTEATVGTPVVAGDLVFASGGYPGHEVLCVRADGSGEVVWKASQKVYVPSMLLHEGYLYTVNDDGLAFCWNAETGEQAWRARVGGNFSSSLVLVGEHIYTSSEQGKTVVFKATPEKFEKVAENQLGTATFATPVVCGDRIYIRAADQGTGDWRETLYCIGITAAE